MERTDYEPKLPLVDILQQPILRRSLFKATGLILGSIVAKNAFNPAEVQAAMVRTSRILNTAAEQFGTYKIIPKSYRKAGGDQSKLWLPTKYSLANNLQSLDQGDLVQYGDQYAYINSKNPDDSVRGPEGTFIQGLSEAEANGNNDFNLDWTGWCKAAAVAMGNGPVLTRGTTAFGVDASLDDLMIMDTLYHAYGKTVGKWDDLNEQTYAQALQKQNELLTQGKDTYLIGNTSIYRGYPNQQWWGLVMGINPVSKMRFMVDFLEWEKFEQTRGRVVQNQLYVPANYRIPIELIDPSEPQMGQERYYNYVLFHREVVAVFLGMADAIPKG